MAYANFDDKMGRHPAIRSLSDAAFRLHVCGILYCAEWLTDGRIPAGDVPDLVRGWRPAALNAVLTELVEKGRWVPCRWNGGPVEEYVIHDYLDHNPTREVVLARKAKAKDRAAKSRGRKDTNDE